MQTANNNQQQQQQYRTRINGQIRVPEVRVILSNGDNAGVMETNIALKMAQDEGLDLIEINPRAVPPVVRITNFGKLKYEEKKKAQADKKSQIVNELKEITISPTIDKNDLDHKISQAKTFIGESNRVKISCRFKGRQITHANIGKEKIDYILEQLVGLITPNPQISLDGKLMTTILAPIKK
jgi:translation initiation factor IF-3